MNIETVNRFDLDVINSFLENMKMTKLDESALDFSARRAYKIEINHSIVAFICYMVLMEEVELEAIYVKPEFRKSGYASILIERMQKEAQVLNCTTLFLEVRESNYGAIALYQKYGFKRISCRENYYGNENGLIMKKEMRCNNE